MKGLNYTMYPVAEDYLRMASELDQIKLCIVGRDPYPTKATGIPFCKETWVEYDKRIAGTHVLRSLNIETLSQERPPRDIFIDLLQKGVVFLNASYHFLEKETLSKEKHLSFVKQANKINSPLLKTASTIIAVGDAYNALHWLTCDYELIKAPHPSLQSRNKMTDNTEWDKYWEKGALAKYLI